jgi:hypothetical protein
MKLDPPDSRAVQAEGGKAGRAMSRAIAAVAGIASVLPLVYLVYFVWHITSLETDAAREAPLSLHLAALGLMLVLIGVYLAMVYRSAFVPSEKRTYWAVVLLIANVFALPVFWYVFLWRRADERTL